MYKHFGDNDSPAFVPDFERSRLPRDSIARFDQAWIDWFVTDWLAISGGRIAYGGGPPVDLQDNNPVRQATWGTSVVDGEYDTVNVTIRLPGPETYIRFFYTSFLFDNANDDLPFLNDGTDNLRVLGGNIEFAVPSLGRNLFQFTYLIIPRWTLFPSAIEDPGYNSEEDFRNAPGALSAANIFPSEVPDSLGTWQNISGLIILYDLLNSGLDVFLSGSVGLSQLEWRRRRVRSSGRRRPGLAAAVNAGAFFRRHRRRRAGTYDLPLYRVSILAADREAQQPKGWTRVQHGLALLDFAAAGQ